LTVVEAAGVTLRLSLLCLEGDSILNFEQWCDKNTNISKLARSLKSSVPEQYIGFYLSKTFENIEYQKQFDWLGQKSLDIYIPSLKLAIEYDGSFYHFERRGSDSAKTSICRSHGIKVFRIIEQEKKQEGELLTNTRDSITYFYEKEYRNIDIAISNLFTLINKKFKLSVFADINLCRDKNEIISYLQKKYYQKTIANVWPESKDYWDDNANKCSIFDVFYTDNKQYNLRCPHCGRNFVFYMRYFHNRKSLIPCECEYSKIDTELTQTVNYHIKNKSILSFDDSLNSRRLYDQIQSKIRFNMPPLSKDEIELYKKSKIDSPYLNCY
jgi:very-short-patch-repair endonuclease